MEYLGWEGSLPCHFWTQWDPWVAFFANMSLGINSCESNVWATVKWQPWPWQSMWGEGRVKNLLLLQQTAAQDFDSSFCLPHASHLFFLVACHHLPWVVSPANAALCQNLFQCQWRKSLLIRWSCSSSSQMGGELLTRVPTNMESCHCYKAVNSRLL